MELLRDVRIEPLLPGRGHHVFHLKLSDTGRRDDLGKSILAYTFEDESTDDLLFYGYDFHASPMHAIDANQTIAALLGFLTLKPGDTDQEYFADYTDRQFAFAGSLECEIMRDMVAEFEADPDSDTVGQWAEMVTDL